MAFLILSAALGCGLIAGVFLAFSNFVMPALGRLAPAHGVRAMQSINAAVLNHGFLGILLGTGVACAVLGLASAQSVSEPGTWLSVAGSALYLLGTIAVTKLCHVPQNVALARLHPESAEAERFWPGYLARWSIWNRVRVAAAVAAALLLTLSLMTLSGCGNPLRPIAPPGSATKVERLSQLGVFEGAPARLVPRPGFVPYEVNASLYADGANKRRLVFVPPGTRLAVSADRWQLPVGSYLVKTFSFSIDLRDPSRGERLIETRFLVRTAEGFTASTYLWNDAQTDAVASRGNLDVPVSWIDLDGVRRDRTFHVPGTSECVSCHAGRALGWRSRQLDRAGTFDDGTRDQIAHFEASGLIDHRPPAHLVLSDPLADGPLAARARSYLDANCSHCHGEGGSAERTELFWGLEYTGQHEMPACRPTSDVDGRDRVIVPGHPDQSEFLARMRSQNLRVHMPRGPSRTPDPAGIALLSQWVLAMPARSCEAGDD